MKKNLCIILVVSGLFALILQSEKSRLFDAIPEYSKVILDRQGRVMDAFLTPDDKWRMSFNGQVKGSNLVDALICLEDQRFFFHPGVDPLSLGRAVFQNLFEGRIVSGASTITMQLAKMLYRRPRNIASKVLEARDALFMELFFSKDQILKWYLSLAPYGGNIEGIGAATYRYFQKSVEDLRYSDLATLLLIPQKPIRLKKFSLSDWEKARNRNLNRFYDCGILSSSELVLEKKQQVHVPLKRKVLRPRHISSYLKKSSRGESYFHSTINLDLQSAVENLLLQKKSDFQKKNVQDAGVIVVDNQSGEVLTAVGNHAAGHQTSAINSLFAYRSPGSTLKPVLYAIGLEAGIFLPDTLLQDVPIAISGYKPENYDRKYRGFVQANTALSQSLNIPFIILLKKIGMERFLNELESLGVMIKEKKSTLGLSAAVGSVSIRPWDLAKVYLALANNGVEKELLLTQKKRTVVEAQKQWRSYGSSLMTSAALSLKKRSSFIPTRFKLYDDNPIHWKTGTSQGRKDAWAVGYNQQFTVLTWLGNLDMKASANLVGSDAAGPVFFEVFDILNRRVKSLATRDFDTSHLEEIKVCRYSGLLPGKNCPIKHRNQIRKHPLKSHCRYHQSYEIDVQSNLLVFPGCRENMTTVRRTFLQIPGKVRKWLRQRDSYSSRIPKSHPKCESVVSRYIEPIEIISPRNGETFFLPNTRAKSANIRIPIRWSRALKADTEMTCLLNGEQMDGPSIKIPYLEVSAGVYNLYCSDRYARAVESTFSVQKF